MAKVEIRGGIEIGAGSFDARANAHATARRRTIGMVIAGVVKIGMIVEILLNIDDGIAANFAADYFRIGRRTAAGEWFEQAGNVVSQT